MCVGVYFQTLQYFGSQTVANLKVRALKRENKNFTLLSLIGAARGEEVLLFGRPCVHTYRKSTAFTDNDVQHLKFL